MTSAISLVLTYLVFGGTGVLCAMRIRKPVSRSNWITLGIATIVSQWVMVSLSIIRVFELTLYANYIMQALFAGMFVAVTIRNMKFA